MLLVSIFAVLLVPACDKAEVVQTRTETPLDAKAEIAVQSDVPAEVCTKANYVLGAEFLGNFAITGYEKSPGDVKCFVEYAAECEHFAGEEGYDEERRQFLHDALHKYCPEAQAQLVILKKKYGQNADILRVLAVCDEGSDAICASKIED
jgi:hypothetical protein